MVCLAGAFSIDKNIDVGLADLPPEEIDLGQAITLSLVYPPSAA